MLLFRDVSVRPQLWCLSFEQGTDRPAVPAARVLGVVPLGAGANESESLQTDPGVSVQQKDAINR